MNSAKSFAILKQKIETTLKRHWSAEISKWNADAGIVGTMLVLPAPQLWELNVGTIDGKNVDVTPTLQVSVGSSSFRLVTTCQREESFRISVVATIPDSERGTPQSLDKAQIAARLAAEILETNGVDSPGDDEGTTYRVDFLSSTPLEIRPGNERGAACRLELNFVAISNYQYQPDKIVTAVSPVTYSANRADQLTIDILLANVSVQNLTNVVSGSVTTLTLADADEIEVSSLSTLTPLNITNAYAFSDSYILTQQSYSVSVAAGVATIQIPTFTTLPLGDRITVRFFAWDTVSGNETFFTLNLIKA